MSFSRLNRFSAIQKAVDRIQVVEHDDGLAQQELADKYNHHKRAEAYRMHIHYIAIAGIYLVTSVVFAMILIRTYHFLIPESYRWLSEVQLRDLERIIFSGLILSLTTKYFKGFRIIRNGS